MKALDEYFLMVVFVLLLNRLQVKQVEHKNQIMSLLREQFHYFYNSPLYFVMSANTVFLMFVVIRFSNKFQHKENKLIILFIVSR